jgi:16S rRNA (guanine1516-N2)-methyltransferase
LGNSELIKACTLPRLPISSTHVVDGTAGLGSDSFMLASRGFHVIAIERNPIVFALLNDGIARAQQVCILSSDSFLLCLIELCVFSQADGEVGEIARRIQVIHADSRLQFSQLLDPKPHVVFLDPMYPSPPNQRKQALPKKGMQYLRQIVGSDPDDVESMVEAALNGATRRVILKRPTHAPQELLLPKLGVLKPTHSYTGTRHRFDAFSTSTV